MIRSVPFDPEFLGTSELDSFDGSEVLSFGEPHTRQSSCEFFKDDSKNDPLLTLDRVRLMGHDPYPLIHSALDINHQLQALFTLCGIDLVDFKLEFSYDAHGNLYLADELSPDNMRLWKKDTKERFDKDLFRKDEGNIVEAYKKILMQLRQFA